MEALRSHHLWAMSIAQARAYVGTDRLSGGAQFSMLVSEGLRPEHRVLEYGCGPLHLGRLLLAYLDHSHYHAVEPNVWLVETALEDPLCRSLWSRVGSLSTVSDFAPRLYGFDFVFAHSVLSHAAEWQFPQFFARARDRLVADGVILASLRIGDDSNADAWTYPGVTFFSRETVAHTAEQLDLRAHERRDLRTFYSGLCRDEVHDWYDFTRR